MKEIRTTYTFEEREEVENLLIANNIEYKVVDDRKLYENAYTINPTNTHYVIMVEDAIAQHALEVLNTYYDATDDADSILQQFDDRDLIEILAYHNNYSATKVARATAILIKRGFIGEDMATLVKQKIDADNQPQRAKSSAIVAGYLFTITGWLLGFAIGWFLYFSKAKHTITGEKYYAHDAHSRKEGRNILIFGGLFWLIVFAWMFGN
jgi:hypothetical protein